MRCFDAQVRLAKQDLGVRVMRHSHLIRATVCAACLVLSGSGAFAMGMGGGGHGGFGHGFGGGFRGVGGGGFSGPLRGTGGAPLAGTS